MESLPDEMLLAIFSRLPTEDLERVSRVSRTFRRVAQTPSLWTPSVRTTVSFLLKSSGVETFCLTETLWLECDCRRRQEELSSCKCYRSDDGDLPAMPMLKSLRISLRRGGDHLLRRYGSALHTLYLDVCVQDLCQLTRSMARYCSSLQKLYFPVPKCDGNHLRFIARNCERIETLALRARTGGRKMNAFFPSLRTLIDLGNEMYALYTFVKPQDETKRRLHTVVLLGTKHSIPLNKWTLRVLGLSDSATERLRRLLCSNELANIQLFVDPHKSQNLADFEQLCLSKEFRGLV